MNPLDFTDQPVQLAGQSKTVASSLDEAVAQLTARGWYFDVKHDGVRALALIDGDDITLINRNKANITHRYPDVIAALRTAFPGRCMVLDAELIVLDANGRPDFAGIHRRDAQARPIPHLIAQYPATLMVFDCLFFEGDDVRGWPYQARRALIATEAERSPDPHVRWSFSSKDGATMWEFVKHNALEGLIAKDPKVRYLGGNRSSWIKIKQAFHVSCIVARWDAATAGKDRPAYNVGKGNRAGGIGSLNLTLAMDGKPIEFGEVGTGFNTADLAMLKTRLDAGELLVIDIEINNVTREVKPRFPSYRGIRTDLTAADCTTDQLSGVPVM